MNAFAAAVALLVAATLTAPVASAAAENPSICAAEPGAHIPGDLMVDACYDGTNVVLVNRSGIVLRANTTPFVARASVGPADSVMPVSAAIVLVYEVRTNPNPDPYLLPPGAELTIPTGTAPNEITIEPWAQGHIYGFAQWAANWIPGVAETDDLAEFVASASGAYSEWKDCTARNNFIGDAGCFAKAAAKVLVAFTVPAIEHKISDAKQSAGAAINLFKTVLDVDAHVQGVLTYQRTGHTINVDAKAAPPAPTSPPPPTPTQPSPVPPSPDPTTAPRNDPPPQPPDTPPTPPTPPATWPETVGGVTHTWTNPQNAGGYEGATIANGTTVQIACKLQGFKVANGNPWWYRIASPPWSSTYYASADAFYNNGQTSGPLQGTPYVDPAVADC